MSGKHRMRRNVRRGMAVSLGLSALAVTSGVAVAGPTAPLASDCVGLVQALITAQVSQDSDARELHNAEVADRAARDVRGGAEASAQAKYAGWLAANPEPTTDNTPRHQKWEADRGVQLKARDAAIMAADDAYAKGGTHDRLAAARKAEHHSSGVVAGVRIKISDDCTAHRPPAWTPPVSTPPAPVADAPVPDVQEHVHLPVTH